MYQLTRNGASLGMTEAPTYIKQSPNGCFILCPEPEASGIVYGGTVYHLQGRDALEAAETVALEEVDAGRKIAEAQEAVTTAVQLTGQISVAARLYVQAAADIPDAAALEMPSLFRTWAEVLAEGKPLAKDTIINDGGTLYRVVQAGGVTPQEHQPPHGEGMLAVYRPIDAAHEGTQADPIPYVYGMDCIQGKYYSLAGAVYLCKADMPACVWPPDTAGLWQWEVA